MPLNIPIRKHSKQSNQDFFNENITSFRHSRYEGKGAEFGAGEDFSPYYADGIIALDACTGHSKMVNCIVLEDDDLSNTNET